jgi:hypothetical protein
MPGIGGRGSSTFYISQIALILLACVTNTRYKQIRWLSGTKEELSRNVPENYAETFWNLGEA